jgi:hypothetical protein
MKTLRDYLTEASSTKIELSADELSPYDLFEVIAKHLLQEAEEKLNAKAAAIEDSNALAEPDEQEEPLEVTRSLIIEEARDNFDKFVDALRDYDARAKWQSIARDFVKAKR